MSRREVKKFEMFDRQMPDYNVMSSMDDEIIDIASPPLWIYFFDVQESFKDKYSGLDDIYNEADMINEDVLRDLYRQGFNGEWDDDIIRDGEKFMWPKETKGFYQEPTWTQELSRLGIEEPEELAITFNYQRMLSDLGREIRIGDIVRTFRNKVYRVMNAYVSDEHIAWKYFHFYVVARKPQGLDNLILPDSPDIPRESSTGV